MRRIINVNAVVNRPAHGTLCRLRQRDYIYTTSHSSIKAWITSDGCLLTPVAHTAPSRASRTRAFSSLPSPRTLPEAYYGPSAGLAVTWTSSLQLPLRDLAAGRLRPTLVQPRVVQFSRSFHASSRNEGHPTLFFLVPLLKTSASLTVIKTGIYHMYQWTR